MLRKPQGAGDWRRAARLPYPPPVPENLYARDVVLWSERQAEALRRMRAGERRVTGVMIESHLKAGRQDVKADRSEMAYGQSITDACIAFDDTEGLLRDLAAAVAARRGG